MDKAETEWDRRVEECRIINTSVGFDVKEMVALRMKKRISYIDLAAEAGIRLSSMIDYEHERKPMPEDKYDACMKILQEAL